jgi:hypothetical protein
VSPKCENIDIFVGLFFFVCRTQLNIFLSRVSIEYHPGKINLKLKWPAILFLFFFKRNARRLSIFCELGKCTFSAIQVGIFWALHS